MNACGCSWIILKFCQTLEFSYSQEDIYFQFLVAITETYFCIFKLFTHVALDLSVLSVSWLLVIVVKVVELWILNFWVVEDQLLNSPLPLNEYVYHNFGLRW